MPYVHDPRLPITGGLTDGTVSGTFNVYGQHGDPNSAKVNSASYGAPDYQFWGDTDANMLGHLLMDVNNSGTVPLFLSASSVSSSLAVLSGAVSGGDAAFAALSSALNTSASKWNAVSGAQGGWTATGTYTGSFASDITGSGLSVSGALMYAAYKASASLANATFFSNQINQLQATATLDSGSLFGTVAPWTGALPPANWVSGVMGELSRVSGVLNVSGAKWDSSSGTLAAIVFPLSANLNASASAWNAVSAAFYPLSTSLSGVAYLTSSNWAPSGGQFSITGTAYVSGSPASSSHQFSNGVLNVNGLLDAVHLRVSGTGGANFLENWVSSTLVSYWDASGSVFTSGNFIASGTVYATGGARFGGAVDISGVASITGSVTVHRQSGSSANLIAVVDDASGLNLMTLDAGGGPGRPRLNLTQLPGETTSARVQVNSNAGLFANIYAIGSAAAGFSVQGLNGFGASILADVNTLATFADISGSRFFQLSSTGTGGIVYIGDTTGTPTDITYLSTGTLTVIGVATITGTLFISGSHKISGSFTASAGAVVTGAVSSTVDFAVPGVASLISVSSSYVATSQSLSGVLNSSSLNTPTAIYLKSPNGSIYKIMVDNSGVLSSTLV